MSNTVDDLFYLEQIFENIKTLTLYLTLDSNNKVERNFGEIRQALTISLKSGSKLFNLLSVFNGEEIGNKQFDPTVNDLRSFIEAAKKEKPSEEYTSTFSNKWEEIEKTTKLNISLNRMNSSKLDGDN